MRWQMIKDSFAQTIQCITPILLNGFLVALLNAFYQYYFMPMTVGGEFDFDIANGVRVGAILVFLVVAATSYYAYLFKVGLFGQDAVGGGFALRWGRLEWRLIGYSLLLFIAMVFIFAVVGAVFGLLGAVAGESGIVASATGIVAGLLLVIAIIYLYPRLFLFWPTIVDDQSNPFSAMFSLCRGSTWFVWSVVLMVVLLSLPILIVFGVADAITGFESPEQMRGVLFFMQLLFWQIVALPLGAWFTFVLSRVYLHLKYGQAQA